MTTPKLTLPKIANCMSTSWDCLTASDDPGMGHGGAHSPLLQSQPHLPLHSSPRTWRLRSTGTSWQVVLSQLGLHCLTHERI